MRQEYKGYTINIIKLVGSSITYGSSITNPDGTELTVWDGASHIDLARVIQDAKTNIDSEILYLELSSTK